MGIEKVIIKTNFASQEKADKEYWLSRTPEERYKAAKIIRDRYIKFKYGTGQRLQRFHTVIKRKQS
jgi:hypothetical protein